MAGQIKIRKNSRFVSISISIVLGMSATPAYCYLDPGTGSLIIQGLIGTIAAVGITLKLYWYKIKSIFSDGKQKDTTLDEPQESSAKE
jgi:hypothetical protein